MPGGFNELRTCRRDAEEICFSQRRRNGLSGRLIVLEGLDGSGKATQAGLLYEALCGRGERAMKITFPNYESNSSALVKMYLGGAFGQDVNDVNAYAASSFYSVDRYASYKTLWGCFYHDGGTVIADRYTCLLYTSPRTAIWRWCPSSSRLSCARLPQRKNV